MVSWKLKAKEVFMMEKDVMLLLMVCCTYRAVSFRYSFPLFSFLLFRATSDSSRCGCCYFVPMHQFFPISFPFLFLFAPFFFMIPPGVNILFFFSGLISQSHASMMALDIFGIWSWKASNQWHVTIFMRVYVDSHPTPFDTRFPAKVIFNTAFRDFTCKIVD